MPPYPMTEHKKYAIIRKKILIKWKDYEVKYDRKEFDSS